MKQKKETKIEIKNFSYFDRDIIWWQQHIHYGNAKIPRFKLAPCKLFPLTSTPEKDWFYENDKNEEGIPYLTGD